MTKVNERQTFPNTKVLIYFAGILMLLIPLSSFPAIARADSGYGDPFPGLVSMQEIPGTRVAGDRNINCPWGSERVREGGNTSDTGWTLCVKNYPSSLFPKRADAPTPTATPSPKQPSTLNGLGGYAVVHPNGRVCGVIVATSSDPFGNGGVMPIEYMGCPVGSRIVFQTNPSPTGNVAGWHGENVTYNGSEFVIKNSNSDSATIQTVIQGGVATDSNGRVWDTGSGVTIKSGTSPITDTSTVITDTSTVTTDSKTVTTNSQPDGSNIPTPISVKLSIPDSSTVVQIVNSLTSREVEAQLVAKTLNKSLALIQINTEFANSLLQISATKKGSKPISLSIQTNSKGDARVSLKTNLAGYSVTLNAGAVKLDTDRV